MKLQCLLCGVLVLCVGTTFAVDYLIEVQYFTDQSCEFRNMSMISVRGDTCEKNGDFSAAMTCEDNKWTITEYSSSDCSLFGRPVASGVNGECVKLPSIGSVQAYCPWHMLRKRVTKLDQLIEPAVRDVVSSIPSCTERTCSKYSETASSDVYSVQMQFFTDRSCEFLNSSMVSAVGGKCVQTGNYSAVVSCSFNEWTITGFATSDCSLFGRPVASGVNGECVKLPSIGSVQAYCPTSYAPPLRGNATLVIDSAINDLLSAISSCDDLTCSKFSQDTASEDYIVGLQLFTDQACEFLNASMLTVPGGKCETTGQHSAVLSCSANKEWTLTGYGSSDCSGFGVQLATGPHRDCVKFPSVGSIEAYCPTMKYMPM